MGVATGVGILVAQRYGAKDREQLSVVIGNCITLSAIVSVITMIIGALITRPMLELLSTPASIIDWCADYLMIYFLALPVLLIIISCPACCAAWRQPVRTGFSACCRRVERRA